MEDLKFIKDYCTRLGEVSNKVKNELNEIKNLDLKVELSKTSFWYLIGMCEAGADIYGEKTNETKEEIK